LKGVKSPGVCGVFRPEGGENAAGVCLKVETKPAGTTLSGYQGGHKAGRYERP
jgi:hypothetical protein